MSDNFLRNAGPNQRRIEQAFREGVEQQIKNRFPAVERRQGLSTDELRARYREKNRPVVMEGALSSWPATVGSSRVDLQACKLEYSIVSPK